jgi:hypothetical protein
MLRATCCVEKKRRNKILGNRIQFANIWKSPALDCVFAFAVTYLHFWAVFLWSEIDYRTQFPPPIHPRWLRNPSSADSTPRLIAPSSLQQFLEEQSPFGVSLCSFDTVLFPFRKFHLENDYRTCVVLERSSGRPKIELVTAKAKLGVLCR